MWKFELWFDGNMLTESDYEFDTEEEAEEEAKDTAEYKIQLWKIDDAYSGETVDDFDIRLKCDDNDKG